jgi:hypothetical protein
MGGKPMIRSLGIGVLTWDGRERRTDRYDTVYLIAAGRNSLTKGPSPSLVKLPEEPLGAGTLWAVVLETRESTHIGDLFRGIFPLKLTTRKGLSDVDMFVRRFFVDCIEGLRPR